MWEVWKCPHCDRYYEAVAIKEHKEVCPYGCKKQSEKAMQESGVQERTGGSDSLEGTT